MKVVADSHALVWFTQDSPQLSTRAGEWYVTQTTERVSARELAELRSLVMATPAIDLHPIDVAVADAYTAISRAVLRDPWDRFIVATARALQLPLVTRDDGIHDCELELDPDRARARRFPAGGTPTVRRQERRLTPP